MDGFTSPLGRLRTSIMAAFASLPLVASISRRSVPRGVVCLLLCLAMQLPGFGLTAWVAAERGETHEQRGSPRHELPGEEDRDETDRVTERIGLLRTRKRPHCLTLVRAENPSRKTSVDVRSSGPRPRGSRCEHACRFGLGTALRL